MINSKKFKTRLAELGMTQKDIAKYLDITPATVSQKLNNVRPMYLDEAEKIARLLKINMEIFEEYFFYNLVA